MSGGVQSGVKRPIFPTLGGDPNSQRMLASLNEVVSALLNSGAVLGRIPPGEVLRPKSGKLSLAWGIQNRVDVGVSTGVAQLPAIRPELIGIPLYLNKVTPTGTVTIKPSGKATDRIGDPLIDGAASITRTTPGLTTFMTDGQNWYSSNASAQSSSVSSATGGVGEIQLHDTTYSPVGLWQFQGDLTDSSGNGHNLAVDAGAADFETMQQRTLGVRFNNLRLVGPNATLLAMRGDMTAEFFGSFEDQGPVGTMLHPPNAATTGIVMSYTGGIDDGGSNINYLYQIAFPDVRRVQWFSEHSTGINDTYVPTQLVMPPPGALFHCAAVRKDSRVQFYLNGKPYGTLSPSLFAPTDGVNSRLWFGGVSGTGIPTTGNNFSLASVKLIATSLSAAAVRGEYNRTLGPFLGQY